MSFDPMDEKLDKELFEKQKKEAEKALKKLEKFKDDTYYDDVHKRLIQLEQQYDAGEISKADFECALASVEYTALTKRVVASFDKNKKD